MNTATIKRGAGRGGRGGMSGEARRPVRRKSLGRRLAETLPLDEEQLYRLTTWILGLILLTLIGFAAWFLGLFAMLWAQTNELARRSGLQVARIEVQGTHQMDETRVSDIAFREMQHSMLAVDLTGLRDEIQALPWVKDARVSRRLPDTLIVDIVERKPVAVWQHDGKLNLIDAEGVALDPVDPRAMPDMPFVIGPDANHQTGALARLIEAAPALRPLLAGAIWVGNRRWDLRFHSGETLSLPEGDAAATAALVSFARMDGVDKLLGRGIIRFDMRDPSRFVLRLPPGQSGGEAAPQPSPPTQPETATPVDAIKAKPVAAPATTA